MNDLAEITIRLSPQIEARISEAIERVHSLTDMAWYALAAVTAAAVVFIFRALSGSKP